MSTQGKRGCEKNTETTGVNDCSCVFIPFNIQPRSALYTPSHFKLRLIKRFNPCRNRSEQYFSAHRFLKCMQCAGRPRFKLQTVMSSMFIMYQLNNNNSFYIYFFYRFLTAGYRNYFLVSEYQATLFTIVGTISIYTSISAQYQYKLYLNISTLSMYTSISAGQILGLRIQMRSSILKCVGS